MPVERRLRKTLVTAILALAPCVPGLAAFPLLAATSSPAFGRTLPALGQPAGDPARDAGGAQDPPAAPGEAPGATAAPDGDAAGDPAPGTGGATADAGGTAGDAGGSRIDPALPDPAPDELWIDVSLERQRVRVLRGREVLREMVASTGIPESPTPTGSFRVQNRGEWFFSEEYQQGGWWWVSFLNWGEYLFHSVPTDRSRQVIPEEAARLGTPASHGCVRLAMDDARWIYDNVPEGTRVEIHP